MRPRIPAGLPSLALPLTLALALGATSLATATASASTGAQPVRPAPAAPTSGASMAAMAAPAWRQQFDDPVLTALLAPVAPQDEERAQALARQWVAVRVFHAQWSTLNALTGLARSTQSALMDLPPDTEGREARLARVASQIEQLHRLVTDRAAQRDQAVATVAQLAGITAPALVARIGAPLTEWRLPHLVAEPPTVRLTVSPGSHAAAQRLTDLHAHHEAALQADRAALAARQRLAIAKARAGVAANGDGAGAADAVAVQPTDRATAQAWQDLLLALTAQAGAAGDLAVAWLDHLATAPAPANGPAASQVSRRSTGRPA